MGIPKRMIRVHFGATLGLLAGATRPVTISTLGSTVRGVLGMTPKSTCEALESGYGSWGLSTESGWFHVLGYLEG